MSVKVLPGLSDETRSQLEPVLERIFESSDLQDLTFSQACVHVLLESVRLLNAKQDDTAILSPMTFFLTALLIGRHYADEPQAGDGDLGGELLGLRDWGAIASEKYSGLVDELVGDFFVKERLSWAWPIDSFEDEFGSGIRIDPGLARALRDEVAWGPVTTPGLLFVLIEDDGSGLDPRLRDDRFQGLVDALYDVFRARGGRHARMYREAEEDELVLGVADYAKALATVLRAAKGEFTFALFGRWGSGKTTLISQLRPLLCDPAFYREAISLRDQSKELYARRSYRVVVHNAWKYRSPPEAWIYAYKSLADEAARGFGPIGRMLLAIRTSVHRRGIWPIVGALLMLALLALPLEAKLQLAVMAVSVVGFSTLLYLGAVTTSVSGRVRSLFTKHLRLSSVDERLGMLALVGDDVRALLAAWTRSLKEDEEDRSAGDLPQGRLVLPLVALVTVAAVWATGLFGFGLPRGGGAIPPDFAAFLPESWSDAFAPLRDDGIRPPSIGEWLVFGLWSLLAAGMLGLPGLARAGRPNRVLLVIDDLDRCTADEMLDVIEGMKLLVDDSAVNRRLQVLMLVDEPVLNHAIAHRYAAMIDERVASIEDEQERSAVRAAVRDEVVTEQYEKLFACHVRLAALSDSDVEEVVESLAGRDQRLLDREAARRAGEAAQSAEREYRRVRDGDPDYVPEGVPVGPEGELGRRRAQTPQDRARSAKIVAENARRAELTPEKRLAEHPEVVRARDETARAAEEAEARVRAGISLPAAAPGAASDPLFGDTDVRFTTYEVEELRRLVPNYLRAVGRRPSPRAIRILLFKIQLCRLLLQLRRPGRVHERSIKAILQAFEAASAPVPTAGAEPVLVAIARQVI